MQRTVTPPAWFPLFIVAAFLISAAAVLALPGRALADCPSSITVNNTNDSGGGSLRQALADVCAGGVINFNGTLTASGPATITLTSGELVIDKDMTITGPGAELLAVSGNNASRVFNVSAGVNVTLGGLTVRDGKASTNDGGGINSSGVLTVTNSVFTDNDADRGAGIYTTGALTVTGSTLMSNNAKVYGGAIAGMDSQFILIINSTFAGNSAGASGGALMPINSATAITNSTFVGNSASSGGAVRVSSSSVTIANSILASNPSGANCNVGYNGSLTDFGGNIDDGSSCGFTAATSRSDTDPLLAPLSDYGGGTQTLPLLPGSPAIDGGIDTGCPNEDQRGFYRPQGAGCDSGAFESQGFALDITGGSQQTTDVFSAFAEPLTVTVSSYYNEPVGPGGVITFTPPSEGPGLDTTAPFTAATDVDGLADSGVITANNIAGSYGVTATVRGEGVMLGACEGNPCGGSSVFDLTNERIEPDVNLSTIPNPSVFSEAVSLSASVTTSVPGAGAATGVVTFTVDGNFAGTDMLDANGEATLTINGLAVGSYSVAAEYEGDSAYTDAQSDTVTQVVDKAPTETGLEIKPAQILYGDKVSFGVNVSVDIPQVNALSKRSGPSGLVSISDDSGVIGLEGAVMDGQVAFSGGVIPAGTYTVTATYWGDDNYEGSTSEPATLVVEKHVTNTTLDSSSNLAYVGDPLYFTAMVGEVMPTVVRDYTLAAPTGAVVITGTTGAINLGGSLTNGVLQLPAPALAAGTYTVTAAYLGDERYAPSVSTELIQVLERQLTSTELTLDPNPALVGETLHLTATVGAVNPQTLGMFGGPTGSVEFLADGAPLGSASLINGQVRLSAPATRAGSFAITAHYLGDARYMGGTSDPMMLAVAKRATSTTLTATPNPAKAGRAVTFTATVAETGSSSEMQPSGAVIFAEGGVEFGRADVHGGVATLSIASLPVGSLTITAEYVGDAVFAGSKSANLQQVVQPMPLAVNDAAGAQEQPVTIDVTANDRDPAGGGLTVVSVGVPQFGSATIASEGPRVVYTPPADFFGVDTFTYVIQDKNGNQDEALVAVVVTRIVEGQGTPQVQATAPLTDSTALFDTSALTLSVQAPAGFYTGTLTNKDILFISFTPVVTPTEGTNNPPANLKFGNAEYVLEVYLNGQLLTGQTFAVPLVVAINYDPAVLGSLKPETLGLWYWDGAVWSTDGITILNNDVANHTLTVSMTHFSFYAFFAAAPTDLGEGDEPEGAYHLFLPSLNR